MGEPTMTPAKFFREWCDRTGLSATVCDVKGDGITWRDVLELTLFGYRLNHRAATPRSAPPRAGTTEREALVAVIQANLDLSRHPDTMGESEADVCEGCAELADALLAAGYRRAAPPSGESATRTPLMPAPPTDAETYARYLWLANRVLACDYGDNDEPGEKIGWRIRHDLLPPSSGGRQPAFMFGKSINEAIDTARAAAPREGA